MKKLFLILSLFIFSFSTILACPYCGCGNSNFQIGVLPTFSSAFFGVRYTYSHFDTEVPLQSQFSHDYFHSAEIWGGYKLGKFQVMAFVPYISVHKLSDDGDINSSGLGDITLLGTYQIYSKTKNGSENKRSTSNTLWLGGGIKFHTGQSIVNVNDPAFTVGDFSQSPGTGSTDYILNANHNLIIGNNGLVTNLAYRINTANSQQFHYGNRVYATASYFHSISVGMFVVRPTLGINLVVNGTNQYQGSEVIGSAGYILSSIVGMNLQRGKIGLLMNMASPVRQDLYHGLTRFNEQASVALTFSF